MHIVVLREVDVIEAVVSGVESSLLNEFASHPWSCDLLCGRGDRVC